MYYRWDYRFAKWQGSGRMLARYGEAFGEAWKTYSFHTYIAKEREKERDNSVNVDGRSHRIVAVWPRSWVLLVIKVLRPDQFVWLTSFFFYFEDDFECRYLAFD